MLSQKTVKTMTLHALTAVSLGFLFVQFAPDVAAQFSMNGSEPWFTRDIGPRAPRTDNSMAAAITVLGVAIAFYLGFNDETVNPSN